MLSVLKDGEQEVSKQNFILMSFFNPHYLSRVKRADLIQKAKRLQFKDHPGGKAESASCATFSWLQVYSKCRPRIPGSRKSYEYTLKALRKIEWT